MAPSPITLDATVGRAETAEASSLGDETVVMDTEGLRYHGLNATGSRIWELLSQPMKARELCAHMAAEYEVDPGACEDEVRTFLDDLLQRKVISIEEA